MNLGNTIKKIRKQNNLTQEELAYSIGITQTYLSQIESNHKEPNLSVLKLLGRELKIPLPILFFLSLDLDDIQPEKRDAFNIINPSVNSLIHAFFKV